MDIIPWMSLYPPKRIEKPEFSGKLLVDGDLQSNCILFRFLFDTAKSVHPLVISIKAIPIATLETRSGGSNKQDEKIFDLECNISDPCNRVMKTCLYSPPFLLEEHEILVTNLKSQVSCCPCITNG